jgi:hypothetical protein
LDKSDQLYTQGKIYYKINPHQIPIVRMPREAALDSEFLTLATQFGLEQTNRLQTGYQTKDINDFVARIKSVLRNGENTSDDTEQQEEFNWTKLGRAAMKYLKRVPTITFM